MPSFRLPFDVYFHCLAHPPRHHDVSPQTVNVCCHDMSMRAVRISAIALLFAVRYAYHASPCRSSGRSAARVQWLKGEAPSMPNQSPRVRLRARERCRRERGAQQEQSIRVLARSKRRHRAVCLVPMLPKRARFMKSAGTRRGAYSSTRFTR